jgi:hypothetical protein
MSSITDISVALAVTQSKVVASATLVYSRPRSSAERHAVDSRLSMEQSTIRGGISDFVMLRLVCCQ